MLVLQQCDKTLQLALLFPSGFSSNQERARFLVAPGGDWLRRHSRDSSEGLNYSIIIFSILLSASIKKVTTDITTSHQELHQVFLDADTNQKSQKGSITMSAAVDSCLRRLLEKKKARLAQSVAHFLQV